MLPSRTLPMNCRITPSPPELATLPSTGCRSPAISRISVVFPAPFGPTSAALTPSPIRNDTSLSSGRPSGSTYVR